MPPILRQEPGEFARLLELYCVCRPTRVLEIGVYEGGTLYEWVANAPAGATVVGVDLDLEYAPSRAELASWREDVEVVPIAGDSTSAETVATVREYAPFEWVFIDGSHALADATADWRNYGGMVERGVVAFHDIAPHIRAWESDVPTLWAQIRQEGYAVAELVADPPAGWAGIGVVLLRLGTEAPLV